MKHYSVDDFLCNISCPYKIEVEKKINLLYDLRILRRVKRRIDSREKEAAYQRPLERLQTHKRRMGGNNP